MRNDKYAKAPLLYVHHAQASDVKANMQHNYISKKHKQIKSQEPEKVYEGKGNMKRKKSFYELSDEQYEEEQTEESEEKQTESKKETEKKSFTDMTISEKLEYLSNKPEYAPRISCVVRTTERAYRGIILEYKDNKAKIRSGRRIVEVKDEDIKTIRLIGL